MAGGLGTMPNAQELAGSGVETFSNEGNAAESTEPVDESHGWMDASNPQMQPMLCVAPGLPAIPRKLVERIRARA